MEETAQKAFNNAIKLRFGVYEMKMLEIVKTVEKECFTQSGEDIKKFATCMGETEKKLKKHDKAFNFGLIFIARKTQEFFSKDLKKTAKDYEEEFKPMFNKLFDNNFLNIK